MSERADESTEHDPRPAQRAIIQSDAYPMRVLAGAGTGKTFTMVRKIERLIEEGVPPDRILALTFTNNAADSIREKLVEQVGPRGYDIDAHTYHAICHELLQEYAYHADLDPRYDIATEADKFAIVFDVLDEMPYRFTKPEAYEPGGWGNGAAARLLTFIPAMKREGIVPEALQAYLGPPEWLIDAERIVEQIETAADETVRVGWQKPTQERLEELRGRIAELQAVVHDEQRTLDTEGFEGGIRAYLDAMIETCESLARFLDARSSEIVEQDIRGAIKLPAYLFGSYSSPPSGVPDIGFTLTGELRAFVERCQVASDLVDGYAAYEARLEERNLLDFDDLVLGAVELLDDPTVGEWVAGQWDYVFCDEFQDTDTIQFELVERLVTDGQLFVVGDDDQAIYEWRGANIDNIGDRLTAAYSELTDERLEENFRSRQPILDFANAAIQELDGRSSDKTLAAVGEASEATDGVVTIQAAEELDDEAEQIVDAIARLLTGESDLVSETYAPGDIAILVKKTAHARPIIERLDDAGIPYQLAGDLASESVGVETVLAYLKLLANTADEVNLNRVLTLRYRLHADDLERLNTGEASLYDELVTVDLDTCREPDRVEEARADIEHLLDRKESHSLSRLYRELKDVTNIEWFLSEQERRDLASLDELVASFGEGAVQPELSREFVEFLRLHGTVTQETGGHHEEQPERSASAVNVMTIHRSKGLEFPVVFLPRLTADQWQPGKRRYDELAHVVSDGGSPLDEDFAARDERETRRVFHVAVTRAEELVVLVGRSEDDETAIEGSGLSLDLVDGLLPASLPWRVGGVEFPVWRTVQSSLPPTAFDGTQTLAQPIESDEVAVIRHRGETLTRGEARQRVLSLARSMLDGELEPVDLTALGITVSALTSVDQPTLLRRHSYTSLDTLERCTRRHYLDYVVRAFSDPQLADTSESGPTPREIGVLFHETAERAADRSLRSPEEWCQIARQIAGSRGLAHAVDAVDECIDRYFETEASRWEILSAERSFDLNIDGRVLTGKIDVLSRTGDGDLVVLDYKATSRKRSLDEDLQLPIYLLACEDVFDLPIQTAGYVYVGEVGPAVETRTFTTEELDTIRADVETRLSAAEESSFAEYSAGEHCRWCPHRSLPCSEEAGLD